MTVGAVSPKPRRATSLRGLATTVPANCERSHGVRIDWLKGG